MIENQYGGSDHDHLGKLVTYAAQSDTEAERVLGVWLVEELSDAHLAAVEFLNRISAEHVGWVLMTAKFIPAPTGYYVHFEKHAEPNAFLREAPRSAGRSVPHERVDFMQAVHGLIDEPLRQIGYRNVYCHPRGRAIRAYLPSHLPAAAWAELRVLAGRDRFRAVLFIGGDHLPAEENERVLETIRQLHAAAIEAVVLRPEAIEWHARGTAGRSAAASLQVSGGLRLCGCTGWYTPWARRRRGRLSRPAEAPLRHPPAASPHVRPGVGRRRYARQYTRRA